MSLGSHLSGRRRSGDREGRPPVDPVTGAEVVGRRGAGRGGRGPVDIEVDKAPAGRFIVTPRCTHGGPDRAGGGRGADGLGGLGSHVQRTAAPGQLAEGATGAAT